jgi:oligopeptide transport system substrate-binding protein
MTSTVPLERYCPACGAANEYEPSEDARCFACGTPLDDAAPVPPSNGERLAPGDLLHDRYRIINQVGTGGYGAVYRALDTRDGDKLVAIKAIHLRGLKPQEAIEATDTFNREVSLLAGLAHPNLPRVYDHFTDVAHWFLVMDFIEGETLEDYIRHTTKTGQLRLSEILEIGIQLCTVLEYLHTRQPPIIFRDVKPANIMRSKHGHLYLIDFGIARRHKPGQRKDTIALGSPGYAAPEQYGRAQTTAQADIYSLGVTLHQLLTGHDPAETPFHLPLLTSFQLALPPKLITLIERMLDLDASQRPENMVAVRQALQDIAAAQIRATDPLPDPLPDMTSRHVYYYVPSKAGRGKLVAAPRMVRKSIWKTVLPLSLLALILGGSILICVLAVNAMRVHVDCMCEPTGPMRAANQILRIGAVSNGKSYSLDPTLANDTQANVIAGMLFSTLTVQDYNNVSGGIAEAWNQSPDGLNWTFHLRPGLRFSDGSPLTSADVAYSLNRALLPATHSPMALATLGMIKDAQRLHAGQIRTLIGDSILAPDPYTLFIVLAAPASYLLEALSMPVASVVSQQLATQYGNRYFTNLDAVHGASGLFAVAQQTATTLRLVPNPNFYGPHSQLTAVIFSFYASADLSYQAYNGNKIEITPVPLDLMTWANSKSNQSLGTFVEPILSYYGMNYLEKPFDNIHIRQAFDLALDKDLLAQTVWRGTRIPINSLVPQGVAGYSPTLEGPDGRLIISGDDVQQAKADLQEGLQEEGWSNVAQMPPITFTYASGSPEQAEEIGAVVQLWHEAFGVAVKPRAVSAATLNHEISATVNNPNGLQMWAASWQGAYSDPQQWTSLPFGAGSPFNAVNYGQNHASDFAQQQQTQQMLAAADTMSSGPVRLEQYATADLQLANDVAWIPMFQEKAVYQVQPYVFGYMPAYGEGMISLSQWNNVFIGQH